jgi:polyphosphate:AMP phosphotransferase
LETAESGRKSNKKAFASEVAEIRNGLLHAQDDLAETDIPVLILIDGDDFVGGEALFDRLHEWLDARFLRSTAYARATPEEEQRPFMWRFWLEMPPRGRIGVFQRSWHSVTWADRISGRIDDQELDRRIEHVRSTEQGLCDDGALIVKLWLHLPKKELKKRVDAARKDETWRYHETDSFVYKHYAEGVAIAKRIVGGTGLMAAPWTVIDTGDSRQCWLTAARKIAHVLRERLDTPRYAGRPGQDPTPEADAEADEASTPREDSPDVQVSVLDGVDLGARLERAVYRRSLDELQAELSDLQREAWRLDLPSVFVFEGWDAAGKGGAIRRMTHAMRATKYKVFPISAPDDRELSRHWLWRFWRRLPKPGHVSIFDRSWYGRVLVERVQGFATSEEWKRAYAEIEDFEAQLVESGTVLRKFWIHIDAEEQQRRFEDRQRVSFKRHKLTAEDWRNRERWHDYEVAAADMVEKTSGVVPWTLVAGNDKRHARIEVLKTVCEALRESVRK